MREDLKIKKLREKISTHKKRLLTYRRYTETLQTSYEQVIREHRKQIETLINSAPKAFFLYLKTKFSKWKS